jgi:uncharacterized protein involved in exopolysaccharide biosynthesis
MASSASPPPASETDLAGVEASEGVDFARLAAIARFVLRAPRRRPGLTLGVLFLALLATAAVAAWAPRVYVVSTKILMQRNVVIPLLGNPRRPLPADWDVPTRGTSETILRRDNLVAIIKETNLTERWDIGRSPALKLLDRLGRAAFGSTSQDDDLRALVETLEKKITVQADETTITISLLWHDPEVAYQLVSCVERNFLQERGATETSAITETIAILEDEAARQREAIDAGLVGAQKAQPAPAPALAQAKPLLPRSRALPERGPTIAGDLAQKRAAIQAIEDPWQRRLVDLKAQLATLRLTYASAHPSVIVLEEKIRQASVEPPELTELKREEGTLLDQVKLFSSAEGKVSSAPLGPLGPVAVPPDGAPELGAARDDSPEFVAAKARLVAAVQKYEDLRDRIDSARLEINTARAAFKYRYAIVVPAEVPKRPSKPNVIFIVLGGLALSIVLAFAAAGAKDFASDRFLEAWQVKRLPIPLLAEVKTP